MAMSLEQAKALHKAGKLAAAEPLYREFVAANPGHAEGLHMLGVLHLQGGRADEAIELIGRAVVIEPGNPAYQANLGSALAARQQFEAAIEHFRRAVAVRPDNP